MTDVMPASDDPRFLFSIEFIYPDLLTVDNY